MSLSYTFIKMLTSANITYQLIGPELVLPKLHIYVEITKPATSAVTYESVLADIVKELQLNGASHVAFYPVVAIPKDNSSDCDLKVALSYNQAPVIEAKKRTILHITVGDKDWEPSKQDLDIVMQLFKDAKQPLSEGVVVTRRGIKCTPIEVQETDEIKVVSAQIASQAYHCIDVESLSSVAASYLDTIEVCPLTLENIKRAEKHCFVEDRHVAAFMSRPMFKFLCENFEVMEIRYARFANHVGIISDSYIFIDDRMSPNDITFAELTLVNDEVSVDGAYGMSFEGSNG